MSIRKVGLSDLRQLQEIAIKTYLHHYEHLWNPGGVEWYLDRCFGVNFLQKDLVDSNVEYYIIETHGENIGMMKLVLKKAIPDSNIENALYLEKIYFVEEWTGKGVGKKSIEYALHRAKALSRECVWLMAMDTSSKPIAAYERAGFSVHSHTVLDEEFELMKKEFRGMVILKNCLSGNGN